MNLIRATYKAIRFIRIKVKPFIFKMIYYNNIFYNKIYTVSIGKHSFIDIGKNGKLILGDNFNCREFVKIKITDGIVSIGDNVFFNTSTSITARKRIEIGDNCIIGENVKIYDHNHNYKGLELIKKQGYTYGDVKIGNNVWIGSNCTILKGVTIGDNSVIGANTVILKDVPNDSVTYNETNLVTIN